MPDPVNEPNANDSADLDTQGDAPPEGHEEFAKHLDYAMNNHPALKHLCGLHKKYEMDAAATPATPGATNTATTGDTPPADDKDKEGIMRNERQGDVQKTAYQRQLDEQEKRIKATEKELADERARLAIDRQQARIQKYEMTLKGLADEFELDVATELADVVELDEKGFEKHVERIKRSYARTPVGGDLPHDAIGEVPGEVKSLEDPEVGAKIHRYMRANPEFVQRHGQHAFIEAAKTLKLIN